MKMRNLILTLMLMLPCCIAFAGTAERIRENATSTEQYPLPLVSAWITGDNQVMPNGWDLEHQIDRIEQGYYLLPVAQWGASATKQPASVIERLAELGLPISFRINNILSSVAKTPAATEVSPGVYNNQASPLGDIVGYFEAGQALAENWAHLATWQALYPDPPIVVLADNNEAKALAAATANQVDIRATTTTAMSNDEWIDRMAERRRAMHEGLKAGAWPGRSIVIGYSASPVFYHQGLSFVRGVGEYGRLAPLKTFDGGSWHYYLDDWQIYGNNDYSIWSPQNNAMNIKWGLDNIPEYNGWWMEASTWLPKYSATIINKYAADGQILSDARHRGWQTYGMWIVRPRVIRPFYGSTEKYESYESQYLGLLEAVKQINDDPVLADFWRHGELLMSTSEVPHAYQMRGATQFEHNYLLEVPINNLTIKHNDGHLYFDNAAVVKVWALALKLGEQTLVYAFAPNGDLEDVEIIVPGVGPYVMDVATSGSYAVIGDVEPEPTATPTPTPLPVIDINSASADQLMTLPRIGPALAARIIAARPFASVDDLTNVSGIGAATLANLRGLVMAGEFEVPWKNYEMRINGETQIIELREIQ